MQKSWKINRLQWGYENLILQKVFWIVLIRNNNVKKFIHKSNLNEQVVITITYE